MAIIQGSNSPLRFSFDESVEHVPEISVGVYSTGGSLIKHWDKADMIVDGDTITCNLTQQETAAMNADHAVVEVKLKEEDGTIILFERVPINIEGRHDKGVVL